MTAVATALGTAAVVGLYLLVVEVRSGESAHIDVTPLTLGFAAAAGVAMAAGTVALRALRSWRVGLLFALAAALLAFSFLAMFSIGLAVLPAGLVVLALAIRRLRREAPTSGWRTAASGTVIGIGAIAFLLVANQPAVAECREGGGVASSSGGLFGGMARSSGGYVTAAGIQLGYIDEAERIAYFTCEGATLTGFRRVPLPAGDWSVTTQPFPTVGRNVMIIFRAGPAASGDFIGSTETMDFTATCATCAEPRPSLSGRAVRLGPAERLRLYAGHVAFPAAGTWRISPTQAAVEVR
ncbi:MAG: hypothetical protein ACRDGT_10025 [Candidatus Limnocylindria bacterium]